MPSRAGEPSGSGDAPAQARRESEGIRMTRLARSPGDFMSTPDPLPSWNEGAPKRAILEFVDAVTDESGPDRVPVAERLAVFDNDGTLWPERPLYTQLAFALARVGQLAPEHPEWKTTQPFQAVLDGDLAALGK